MMTYLGAGLVLAGWICGLGSVLVILATDLTASNCIGLIVHIQEKIFKARCGKGLLRVAAWECAIDLGIHSQSRIPT